MAKTRSQTGNIAIKKEEDCKDNLLLNGVSNTTKRRAKITKPKPSKNKKRHVPAQQVKVEEDADTKSLLKPASECSKIAKRRFITQEQINQLIDYVENRNVTVRKASHKVKISIHAGYSYYNEYKNDPDKKIPSPRSKVMRPQRVYTQEQVGNFIRHIVDEKMTLKEAAAKQDLTYDSGKYYYNKYLDDPDHNIPIPKPKRYYTQDQKNEFIGYIINDKMTISAASRKARMDVGASSYYYHKYFDAQNPAPSHIITPKNYTQEQIKQVISYIVKGKMSIYAASRKANMDCRMTGYHYRRYLKDNNMEIPVSKNNKRYTQDKIDELVDHIVNDKMSIRAASKKTNMNYTTGQKYYRQYLKQHNLDLPIAKFTTQEQIDQLIGCIVGEKMTIKAASNKAKVCVATGRRFYYRYLKQHNLALPIAKFTTQDQVDQLIGYIVNDKMTMKAASNKANMDYSTGRKYYHRYLKDHNIKVSARQSILQDQRDKLIGYIVNDKMSILAASRKANLASSSGQRYYNQYLKEHNLDKATPNHITQYQQNK